MAAPGGSSLTGIRKDKRHQKAVDCEYILESLAKGGVCESDSDDSEEFLSEDEVDTVIVQETADREQEANESDESASGEDDIQVESTQKIKTTKTKVSLTWSIKQKYQAPDSSFKGPPVTVEDLELPTPYSLFSKYYDEEFFESVCSFTNIYAIQKTGEELHCTPLEIRQLFAVHIIMGTLGFPQLSMYWSSPTRIPSIADVMTRKRFHKLRTNLHIVDCYLGGEPQDKTTENDTNIRKTRCEKDTLESLNTTPQATAANDKLWKLRPLINRFQKCCKELPLHEHLCIDEQIIPCKGRVSIKQYVKNKPYPWGIKVFLLCSDNGLIHDLIIYQGRNTEYQPHTVDDFGLGPGTVIHLAQHIPRGLNYKLFFDNYFNSFTLLVALEEQGIKAAGTIRKDRLQGCPLASDKRKKKERGSSTEVCSKENICVVVWKDNKDVTLASNFVGIGKESIVQRWEKKKKEYIEVTRPEVIEKYNESMGGINKVDHLIALYRIFIRSRKWTLRVWFHFVDLAIVNSWLEYKIIANELNIPKRKKLSLLHFRQNIAESLLKCGISPRQNKRGRPSNESQREKRKLIVPRPVTDVRYDCVGHFPVICGEKQQRCKLEGCGRKTNVSCEKCDMNMCLTRERNCFKQFHVKI